MLYIIEKNCKEGEVSFDTDIAVRSTNFEGLNHEELSGVFQVTRVLIRCSLTTFMQYALFELCCLGPPTLVLLALLRIGQTK